MYNFLKYALKLLHFQRKQNWRERIISFFKVKEKQR
jgi:hypothetical protein